MNKQEQLKKEKPILKLELHDVGYDEFTICGDLGNDECTILLELEKGKEEEAQYFIDAVNKLISSDEIKREVLQKEQDTVVEMCKNIISNDKTPRYSYGSKGKNTLNANGQQTKDGSRWMTPAEIAQNYIDVVKKTYLTQSKEGGE